MTANSKIEWTDHTFNPWEGCQKVGPGCDHCYAENRNSRFNGGQAVNWGPGAPRRRTSTSNWNKPLAWNRNAGVFYAQHRRRQRVFCASLADVFDNQVADEWRRDLAALILQTTNLDWLLLTKRIGNAAIMLADIFPAGMPEHVWLGATVVNQEEANRDIPKLLATPASVRFLSIEPLLGQLDLSAHIAPRPLPWLTAGTPLCNELPSNVGCARNGPHYSGEFGCRWSKIDSGGSLPTLDWVIVGGESGSGARPMHPDWVRSLRDQCSVAGVPMVFKQWGDWAPGEIAGPNHGRVQVATWFGSKWLIESVGNPQPDDQIDDEPDLFRVGKKAAGRLLDGVQHDGYPTVQSNP